MKKFIVSALLNSGILFIQGAAFSQNFITVLITAVMIIITVMAHVRYHAVAKGTKEQVFGLFQLWALNCAFIEFLSILGTSLGTEVLVWPQIVAIIMVLPAALVAFGPQRSKNEDLFHRFIGL